MRRNLSCALLLVATLLVQASLAEPAFVPLKYDAVAGLLQSLGDAVAGGLPIGPIFAEVHRSNMTKAQAATDGKATKTARFQRPDLQTVLAQAATGGLEKHGSEGV